DWIGDSDATRITRQRLRNITMRPLLLLLALSLLAAADAPPTPTATDPPVYVLRGKPKATADADAPRAKGGEVAIAEINRAREEFEARVLAMADRALATRKASPSNSYYTDMARGTEALR